MGGMKIVMRTRRIARGWVLVDDCGCWLGGVARRQGMKMRGKDVDWALNGEVSGEDGSLRFIILMEGVIVVLMESVKCCVIRLVVFSRCLKSCDVKFE